jgi:hypothetical protein
MQSLIGPDPRVIADDIWAKLLWAGLNIGEEDFARTAKLPSFYPLSMIRALALVWLFAGLRGNEIMRLRVHHDQTKGEESRTLPLTGELFEVVKMQLEYTERYFPQCPLLFHRDGESTYDFRKAWETACRRAGLWEGNEDTGKPTRLFHDLRRTGVRNLVRAGVPERVAMMISGHRTRAVFDRYNIVSERDLHDAAAKLDTYLSELEEQHERATFGATRRNSEPRAIS